MNQDKPPTYSQITDNAYNTLYNEASAPPQEIPQNPRVVQNVYQIIVASEQRPTPGTTVNVNTGPEAESIIAKLCYCWCRICYYIIIIILIIIVWGFILVRIHRINNNV